MNCEPPTPFVKTGISEAFDVRVYPNPTTGLFKIETNGNDNTPIVITIYNVLGKPLKSRKVSRSETLMLDSKFTTGVYFLLAEQDGRKKVIRMVKQ